jgi:hypothetical protein
MVRWAMADTQEFSPYAVTRPARCWYCHKPDLPPQTPQFAQFFGAASATLVKRHTTVSTRLKS